MTVRTRRRRAVALVSLLALVGLSACGDDAPDGYSAATRAAMLDGCAEDDQDADVVDVCACVYDQMEDDVPFDRFASLENRLGGGDARLPAEVVAIIRDCIRSVAATRT
ncbi:hypothetical protein [Actinomarinicola tropica]|uniref:Uncharacterized protein n=1 Tax=Actinomarinicola tropica TaxID=2789776 RepID=A0A5Q2RL26_9ACTN|nr:hypothetical protein [Actinomarinicola tropica]QGG94560.1 hypothetical protein GH723_05250 [Actinomarinicola tropica]